MGLENEAVYIIQNVAGGTAIDLDTVTPDDGQTIHGWSRHGEDNQKWRALERDDGWVFQNLANGYFISLEVENLADGLRVFGTEDDRTKWEVVQGDFESAEGEDVYRLVTSEHFSLDLSDHGNPDDGTHITVWGSWEGRNQLWRFERVE